MKSGRSILNIILLLLTIAMGGLVAMILWLPSPVTSHGAGDDESVRFGVYENRQLVLTRATSGAEVLSVEDGYGNRLFTVTVKNSIVDSRYRGGRLIFRDTVTGREGFLDTAGVVTVIQKVAADEPEVVQEQEKTVIPKEWETRRLSISTKIENADPGKMTGNHPFRNEAVKVLSGKLEETDSARRRQILNYCEYFRTAYTTRDIDFLRQVFSDNALIIVGNVVNSGKASPGLIPGKKASYSTYSKAEYLKRLARVFETNKKIDVRFSGFRIMRHPTVDGIYGVALRQKYESDRYSDDGLLFLLWDFRDASMPVIHVRTWQAADAVRNDDDAVSIEDFNLE